jgi:hypothetical protein
MTRGLVQKRAIFVSLYSYTIRTSKRTSGVDLHYNPGVINLVFASNTVLVRYQIVFFDIFINCGSSSRHLCLCSLAVHVDERRLRTLWQSSANCMILQGLLEKLIISQLSKKFSVRRFITVFTKKKAIRPYREPTEWSSRRHRLSLWNQFNIIVPPTLHFTYTN